MLSKEEIEKAKKRVKEYMLHINIKPKSTICIDCISGHRNRHIEAEIVISDELKYSIKEILQYIEQLETDKQKLIEKLEEFLKEIKQDGIYGYDVNIIEILNLVKGEKMSKLENKKYLDCLLFTYEEIKNIQKDKYHFLHDFICRWFGTEENNDSDGILYFSEDCIEVNEDDYWLVNVKKCYATVIHNLEELDKKINMLDEAESED